MKWTRRWLILADLLVIALLLLSFLPLFINVPQLQTPKPVTVQALPTIHNVASEENESNGSTCMPSMLTEQDVSLSLTDLLAEEHNRTMSLEEVMRISQEVAMQEYLERRKYQYVSLRERLKALGVKKGDAVYIRIFKKEAILEVWMKKDERYVHLKDYAICAYSGHLGPKLREGDRQAPEGFYRVYKKQLNPHSKFHLAFNLGYPNAYDRAHHRSGSFLMVHGNCVSIGCYAMTDTKIEEIYSLVSAALRNGQKYVPVHIFPFRMEDETMDAYSESRWYDFWMELKEGYDYFEAEEVPPKITVVGGHYVVSAPEE